MRWCRLGPQGEQLGLECLSSFKALGRRWDVSEAGWANLVLT